MWVTKFQLSPVKIRIFSPKRSNWAKNWHFGHFGPGLAGSFGGLVSGWGARAVSRETPIYFISIFFQMILSASSIGVSCYLAYILHFVLEVYQIPLFLVCFTSDPSGLLCCLCLDLCSQCASLLHQVHHHVIVQLVQMVTSLLPSWCKRRALGSGNQKKDR